MCFKCVCVVSWVLIGLPLGHESLRLSGNRSASLELSLWGRSCLPVGACYSCPVGSVFLCRNVVFFFEMGLHHPVNKVSTDALCFRMLVCRECTCGRHGTLLICWSLMLPDVTSKLRLQEHNEGTTQLN